MMKAIVYKSTGNWYHIEDASGNPYRARLAGKLKIDGITSTNPIAVGDFVEVQTEEDLIITDIYPRKNYINRVSPHNRHQHHIVASNLDGCLLFATLVQPVTSLRFIDRFLVTAEAFHIPAAIVVNKSDLFKQKQQAAFEDIKRIYSAAGYNVISTSLKTGHGLEELRKLLLDKTTLLGGNSGVGKTTLLQTLLPEKDLKTLEVSAWSGKGMHTTTFAEMHDLPFGGRVIDTPGIRELGIADIRRDELSGYFPEMKRLLPNCRFNNCQHINEPGCAVKEALNGGTISGERYLSYLTIRDSIH